jgi:type I restriction enzyme S subunit
MATPRLRFNELSSFWEKNKFSECFTFHMTNSYSRAKLSSQGDVMNIHYGDIHTKFSTLFNVAEESVPFITSKTDCLKIKQDQFLRIGDLVIADASEDYEDIGKTLEVVNLDGKRVVAGLHTYIARPNETYATGFFGYLMQTEKVRKQIKVLATGTSVLGISKTNLNKLDLELPSLPEQTKIASFLTAVDTKIDELNQKHELLTEYKKGMMQQLLSQKLRFKADDGSDFEDWEDRTLGEIASKSLVKNKDESISEVLTNSATQGIIKQSDYFEREIVTTSNLKGYYVVEMGDFVYNPRISSQAPVGPIKRNKQCLGVMSPLYTVFTINEGDINYLEYFFESSVWHDYVKSVSNSGARHDRMNIKNQDFFDMPVLYPCLAEQTKIANFLTAIDQKINNAADQIDHAKTWKKSLLQQMFV